MTQGVENIVILGGGESGVGAAKLAVKKGHAVFVSDFGKIKDHFKSALNEIDVEWEEGTHSMDRILQTELVIKSPGISDETQVIKEIKSKAIPVISEVEFAFRYCEGKIIAVTGSNGKSTTVCLIQHMLEKAGLNSALVGNIGQSFAASVAEKHSDYFVLEVSSFQLDDIVKFKPFISILLNITPDHLDRYDHKLENYIESKLQIVRNQDSNDHFIFNIDDDSIESGMKDKKIAAQQWPFSLKKKDLKGAWLQEEQFIINLNNNPIAMSVHELALQGKHNIYNSMAASIAGRILELRKELIRESLSDFQNIEHRLEFVMKVHGISFINDSKATNVNSTWYALESIERNVIWIAGGVDKGNDYSALNELVADKVKAIVCLGKDNKKLTKAFKSIVPDIVEADSASKAVNLAYELGKPGDSVLLSPACASFDLFDSYEDRGHQFKKAVKAL